MKKLRMLSLVFCSGLFLSACQVANDVSQVRTTEKRTEEIIENTEPTTVVTQITEPTVTETTELTSADNNSEWESAYAWSLEQIGADQTEGHATHYAFYDIDGNGSMEMVTGQLGSDGQMFLLAIYYLKFGKPTYLSESYVRSAGGGRAGTTIFTDGTVAQYFWYSGSGDGEGSLYALRWDNSGHDILDQQEFEKIQFPDYESGRTKVDIQTFDWRQF